MHDPQTRAFRIGPGRNPFLEVWHQDPCSDHTDDSCGWFIRGRHMDQSMRAGVRRDFEFEAQYWFGADGKPLMSPSGLALQMFQIAAWRIFNMSHRKRDRWLRKNLHSIMNFAENPIDCLFGFKPDLTPASLEGWRETKQERIHSFADCVATYILRDIRPWYMHPRWHIHHWRLSFPMLRTLKRQLSRKVGHA